MKKFILIFSLGISLFTSAQKKESKDTANHSGIVPAQDTVFVLSKNDMQLVQAILRQNTLAINGKALTFDDVLVMINGLDRTMMLIPKEQPKEEPKKR